MHICKRISWGKGGRCVGPTTLPPSCSVVMISENLNFLEPSGPLQACNGTALPLPVNVYTYILLYIQTKHVRDTSHQSKSQTQLLGTKAVSGKFQYLLHKYDVKRS